jgi:peptidoglycan/xylan/chitin deacetylase (PgdA/CDA1 family)
VRDLKRTCLSAAKSLALFHLAADSRFRNSRLLVLGYHGVALEDEHRWNPALYLEPDTFRRQMETLRRTGCTVLSLDESLCRLDTGDLPERSVVLTFDDGTYDFYKIVCPVLKEFGYSATLYLTTYYVDHQYPVPRGIWSYMLWKARCSKVNARELLGTDVTFDLSDEFGRAAAWRQMISFANSENMDGHQRNALSVKLAKLFDLDFAALCSSRIISLLRPEEVRELAREGVSVQMHMHVHSSPPEREAYIDNLRANRERIAKMTGSEPNHFAYPSGCYTRESVRWLRDYGVRSAATCDAGLFAAKEDPLLIPRLVVTSSLSDIGFESWLVGIGALISGVGRYVRRVA